MKQEYSLHLQCYLENTQLNIPIGQSSTFLCVGLKGYKSKAHQDPILPLNSQQREITFYLIHSLFMSQPILFLMNIFKCHFSSCTQSVNIYKHPLTSYVQDTGEITGSKALKLPDSTGFPFLGQHSKQGAPQDNKQTV